MRALDVSEKVLRGAARSLAAGSVGAVYVEVSCDNLERQGFGPEDVLGPLRAASCEPLYVKDVDLRRVAETAAVDTFDVGGLVVQASPVGVFPTGHQTDMLAVHRDRLREQRAQ